MKGNCETGIQNLLNLGGKLFLYLNYLFSLNRLFDNNYLYELNQVIIFSFINNY